MANTKDMLTLVSLGGSLLRNLPKDADWEIEEVKGSTNRLTVKLPLSDSFGITTDQELIFRGSRYIIGEITRYRDSKEVTVIADEAQIELTDKNIPEFILTKSNLTNAIAKALGEDSIWKVGNVFADTNEYYADITNKSSMYCLLFLENQSGGRLVFDSIKRVVHMEAIPESAPEKSFRYKKNVEDISKNEIQPQATILYPYGKEGMNVSVLNDGKEYLEDFSWYTDLGMTLEEARARYSKEYVWEDDSYIFVGNLYNDAKKKLATMSHPQINYIIKASGLEAEELSLNERVYVIDEELDIKIVAVVSRLRVCKDTSQNEIELDYLPSSLSDLFNTSSLGDNTGSRSETAVFLVKNTRAVKVNATPAPVLTASVTVFTTTYFQVGVTLTLECTTAGLLEGYLLLDGEQVGAYIKQTVGVGWHTLGLPLLIPKVTEGTKKLHLYLSTTGSVNIDVDNSQMFILSQGAYGGKGEQKPDQDITEDVVFMPTNIQITEKVNIAQQGGLRTVCTENVAMNDVMLTLTESAFLSVEKLSTVTRANFAKVANYPNVTMIPSQLEIDSFIDSFNYSSKVFKVVMIGGSWQVVATTGVLIYVDTLNKVITSDGRLSVVSVDGMQVYGNKIDYSSEAGALDELEFYKR